MRNLRDFDRNAQVNDALKGLSAPIDWRTDGRLYSCSKRLCPIWEADRSIVYQDVREKRAAAHAMTARESSR
jgi:hypothetical protein